RIAGREGRDLVAAIDDAQGDAFVLEVGDLFLREGNEGDLAFDAPVLVAQVEGKIVAPTEPAQGLLILEPAAGRIKSAQPLLRGHGLGPLPDWRKLPAGFAVVDRIPARPEGGGTDCEAGEKQAGPSHTIAPFGGENVGAESGLPGFRESFILHA